MLLRRLFVPCVILAAPVCLLAQNGGAVEQSHGAWEGKGNPMVEDFKDSRGARTYLLLHTSEGDLKVEPANPAALRSGTHRYRVEGARTGRTVAAESVTPLDSASSGDTCSTTGAQNTIAIPVQAPGALNPNFTPAQIQDWLFGSDPSLNGYIQDASYGQTSVTGTVTGWFTLDQTYTADQTGEIQQAVFEQATAQGIDLTQYSRIILFLPSLPDAGFEAGASDVGCVQLTQGNSTFYASVSWILEESSATNTDFLTTIAHEFGHGLGLNHSIALLCGVTTLAPDSDACPFFEYGDPYSVMGEGFLGHYTAPQKYALGWIQDSQVATVPVSGTVTLLPVSAPGAGMRALRTPRTAGGNDWLWMEIREPIGAYESIDYNLRDLTSGALIHFQPQDPAGAVASLVRTQLLEIPPTSSSGAIGTAVGPGGSWTDVFSGLTMSVAQGAGSALSVTVNRNNACFTLGASTATVSGGGGTGTVQVSAPASCSWSASSNDSWLTIQSGASGSGSGTVTFLAAANSGVARQGVLLIGGLGVLISQAPQIAAPVVLPLSPATVTGPSAFLNLGLTDNTPFNYSTVTFNITSGPPAQPACEMAWNEPNHQFLLTNDDGISYSIASDSNYLIDLENSTCAVLIALPEFYGDDTQFSFEVEVVWKKPAGASQTVYLRAQDLAGNDTGWQSVGSWTTTVDQPPSPPVMPNVPGVGLSHLFSIEASDPDGLGDIQSVELDIGSGSHLCSMIFLSTISQGVEFLNDDGTRSGWVTGNPGNASNSSCSLDLLRTQSSSSGGTETVLLPVTFMNTLAGQQPVQAIVTDWSGKTGTLNTTWNVAASGAQPAITAAGIVNGASFAGGGLAVGEIVTIFGSNLGPSPLQTAAVVNKELQQAVAGTTVFFEGAAAPLIYASQDAVTAIVPPFLPQTVHVEVASAGGISNVVTLPQANAAPGIFTYPSSQQAVAVNQDDSFNINTPASRGSYLTLYVSGDGNLIYNNAGFLDFGGVPPSNPWATVGGPFLVQFGGGTPVQASFAGLTFPGVLQVNVQIDPNAPAGDAVPVQIVIPNAPGPNITSPVATVRIQQ